MSDKIDKIKASLAETCQRRKTQNCKVYELKVDLSHLSNTKYNNLTTLFIEAKWLYNHILSQTQNNISKFDTKIDSVLGLDKDRKSVVRNLSIIGSQIKQSIHSRMIDSTKALSVLKKNGHKVGKLKFKSRINSIPLKQHGVTYKFHDNKPNYVKIQGIKGYFKINGIKQVPKDAEIANATLVNKGNNFYLMLTCFVTKQAKVFPQQEIGIDFGIESTITLSNGEKIKVDIPENSRSKMLRRKLSRKQGSKKGERKSKSYFKNLDLLNKSISKTNHQKKDAKDKIVSKIVNTYKTICVQDENLKQWKDGNFGKQVHNSILGGIMKGLQLKSHTLRVVDRYAPTTQLCSQCFRLNKHSLEQREYNCECGYKKDRDIHSAQNILEIGMNRIDIKKVLVEHKHYKSLMEETTSFGKGRALANKSFPMKSEAHEFIRG